MILGSIIVLADRGIGGMGGLVGGVIGLVVVVVMMLFGSKKGDGEK